jgi:hypothetical protein
MTLRAIRAFAAPCLFAAIALSAAHAQCPVNSIVIKGHVEHLPRHATVKVELFYLPDPHAPRKRNQPDDSILRGESAEAILDGAAFSVPVEFVSNNRRPMMSFGSRCDRKPESVVVTLLTSAHAGDAAQELDRVSLDFPHDFKSDDQQHFTLTDLVLNGQPQN